MIEIKYLPRKKYMEQTRAFINSPIIKVYTGQRRSGKSYVLYQIIAEIKKLDKRANIIYINTELPEFQKIKDSETLYDYVVKQLQKKAKNYLFVDEIQEVKNFEKALRALLAQNKCDIYCTGSNAHLLSGELATYLAGRYIQIHVHPLSYIEFLQFYKLKNTLSTLDLYLKVGGLPYLAMLAHLDRFEEQAAIYLQNIYESILLRDVVSRENIRNVNFLANLTKYLADNTGSLFSANNISKYLKSQKINIPVQTVINYLAVLEKAYLIHKVSRSRIGGLKIFEIGEKYYFEDIGLRNILSEDRTKDIAKVIENAVYLFLIQQEFQVTVGKLNEFEIDFVAEKQNKKIYVQVAYRADNKETYNREFGNLEKIKDQFPKYVVTMDNSVIGTNSKGIKCVHLKDFLMLNF